MYIFIYFNIFIVVNFSYFTVYLRLFNIFSVITYFILKWWLGLSLSRTPYLNHYFVWLELVLYCDARLKYIDFGTATVLFGRSSDHIWFFEYKLTFANIKCINSILLIFFYLIIFVFILFYLIPTQIIYILSINLLYVCVFWYYFVLWFGLKI